MKKALGWVMAILMTLTMVKPISSQESYTDTSVVTLQMNNLNEDLSGLESDPGTDPATVEANKVETTVRAATTFQVGEGGTSLKEPWLLISLPKSHLKSKPNISDSNFAWQKLTLEDDDNYYFVYKFHELSGGRVETLTYPFEFDINKTSDGDMIQSTAKFLDTASVQDLSTQDLSTILSLPVSMGDRQLTRYYKASKQVKYLDDMYLDKGAMQYDSRYNRYFNSVMVPAGTKMVPNYDPGAWFNPAPIIAGSNNGLGEYVAEKVKKVTLDAYFPEGFHVDRNQWFYNLGWKDFGDGHFQMVINESYPTKGGYNDYRGLNYGYTTLFSFNVEGNKVPFKQDFNLRFTYTAEYEHHDPITVEKNVLYAIYPSYFSGTGNEALYEDNWNNVDTNGNVSGSGTVGWTGQAGEKNTTPLVVKEGGYILDDGQVVDLRGNDQSQFGMFYSWSYNVTNNGGSLGDYHNGKVYYVKEIKHTLFAGNYSNGGKDAAQGANLPLYYQNFAVTGLSVNSSRYTQEEKQALTDQAKEQFAHNKLYGIDKEGNETLLTTDLPFGRAYKIADTQEKYVSVVLRFDQALRLENQMINGWASGMPTQAEKERLMSGGKPLTYFARIGVSRVQKDYDAEQPNETEFKANSSISSYAYTSLMPVHPMMNMTKEGSNSLTYQNGGNNLLNYTTYVDLGAARNGTWSAKSESLKNVKVVTLLPPGISFKTFSTGYYVGKVGQPEIISNYKGTGKTGVIFTIPEFVSQDKNLDDVKLSMVLEASPYASAGNNEIVSYTVVPDGITPQSSVRVADELDLDEDGDYTDSMAKVSHTFLFVPPLSMVLKHYDGVEVSAVSNFDVTADLSQPAYYRLLVSNNGVVDASSAYVLDTLPSVDDVVIAPNAEGGYPARHQADNTSSEFAVRLNKALEDLPQNEEVLGKYFDVEYSLVDPGTVSQPTGLPAILKGEWLTKDQVTDFSKVRSFRLKMKAGSALPAKTSAEIYVPVLMPSDTSLVGKVAYNLVSLSTDNDRYGDANLTSITPGDYDVDGTVFEDLNQDSVMDQDEKRIENVQVKLMKLEDDTWVQAKDLMLMYGKEASNRKQEIDRQHYTIPNQRPKDKHCGKI